MANDLFDARVVSAPQVTVEHTEFTSDDVTEGLRLAHYCALEEFVGLAFCCRHGGLHRDVIRQLETLTR